MRAVDRIWNSLNPISLLLSPLSLLFSGAVWLRRSLYRFGILRAHRCGLPVIIIGNITVGGTGKTPLVAWTVEFLRQHGWRPGIVSRGYGGKASHWPQQVRADSDPAMVGDEAVMLAARTACPVCVGPDRIRAAEALREHTDVDIIVSDDGLQHYALARDLEIAVIDGARRFGNGLALPAGPLRERPSRLEQADMVVVNGVGENYEYSMQVRVSSLSGLHDGSERALDTFAGSEVYAVAGIGNPERFFDALREQGIEPLPRAFPDHHAYRAEDLCFDSHRPVLMTEKDAVKCRRLPCEDCWVVNVNALPDAPFVDRLKMYLKDIADGQETTRYSGLPDL